MAPDLAPLTPGSRVALVAPSGPVPRERFARAEALLKSWGLVPVEGSHVFDTHSRADYLAGPDAGRAHDLMWALTEPTIDAVLCVRGGYGAIRILDLLDADRVRRARTKPVFGSSDVTAILEWLHYRVGRASWFAPMVATKAVLDDESARACVRSALIGVDDVSGPGSALTVSGADAGTLVPGTAVGTAVGGNLSVLAMTAGTAAAGGAVGAAPTIALLEDVTEEPYRIDALLQRLLRVGWFDNVAGIALGSWAQCGPLDQVKALMTELLAPLGVPLAWNLNFGHGPGSATVPLGVPTTLVCEPGSARLDFDLETAITRERP